MNRLPEVITGAESVEDPASPLVALSGFYRAFNQRDLSSMERNWLQTEEASMSNPLGGLKRGWAEIRPVYEAIFHGLAEVYVEYHDYSLHAGNGMFCAVGRERGYLKLNGTEIPLAIRTSRIFVQAGGEWRQLHHHGSMDDPALLQAYQSVVLGKRGAG